MTFNVDKNFKSEGITPAEPNFQKNEVELSKLRQEALKKIDSSITTENVVTPPPQENKSSDSLKKIGIASVIDAALTNLADAINPNQMPVESKKLETSARQFNYGSIDQKIDDLLKELDDEKLQANPQKISGTKPQVIAPLDMKIETIMPKMIHIRPERSNIPVNLPALSRSLYEKDMKIIQNWLKTPEGKSCLVGVDLKTGERHKFSRTFITDLTHSYIKVADGTLIQQMHKTNGLGLAHQAKDSRKSDHSDVVKGKGGFKKAMAMSDGQGNVTMIRAVVHKSGSNMSNAITATKNVAFQNCEYLMVGHYVTYINARGETKEAFLSDYMPDGDLENQTLNFIDAINVSLQMAQGVQVIHDKGWVHLDIKPANIFHYVDDNNQYVAKLADFDLARDGTKLDKNKTIFSGTPAYISPEMMRNECFGLEGAQKSDVYSLGVSMLELSGFSIWENFINNINISDGKTNKQIGLDFNEFIRGIKVDSPEYNIIKNDFETFKKSLTPLKSYEEDQLNLAWSMINPDSKKRPSIGDVALDLFQISIDSTV